MVNTKCDWCGNEEETNSMKYWHTGHLLCISCFNDGRDKIEKMMEELVREMQGCQENFGSLCSEEYI